MLSDRGMMEEFVIHYTFEGRKEILIVAVLQNSFSRLYQTMPMLKQRHTTRVSPRKQNASNKIEQLLFDIF